MEPSNVVPLRDINPSDLPTHVEPADRFEFLHAGERLARLKLETALAEQRVNALGAAIGAKYAMASTDDFNETTGLIRRGAR